MLREKSCGVVPFREVDGEIRYLVISSAVTKREHWEFPKGGVEEGEREIETALRELWEETGVSDVELLPGYREPIRYIYRRAEGLVFKQVVYFIGRVNDPTITPREEEVKDYRWATFEEARSLLRHGNARELLYRSHAFITGKPLPPRSSGKKRRPARKATASRQQGKPGSRPQRGRGNSGARLPASVSAAASSLSRRTPETSPGQAPATAAKEAPRAEKPIARPAAEARSPAGTRPENATDRPRRSRRRRRRRRPKPPRSS